MVVRMTLTWHPKKKTIIDTYFTVIQFFEAADLETGKTFGD